MPNEGNGGVKPLVIGFGNPLCSDDGFGWHAARKLRERYQPSKVRVIAAQQLGPEMARDIADASLVVFIDAEQGNAAGDVACRPVQPRAEAPRTFTHHLSPAALVACARLLFQKCPPAYLVSVVAADFAPGEQLSERVAAALPKVANKVESLLRSAADAN